MPRPRAAKPEDDDFARLYERNKLHRVERSVAPGPTEAYELETSAVQRPALPGDVQAFLTLDQAVDAAAADLVAQALSCVRAFGDFHLALSGDHALEPLYERLMYDPNCRRLPWARTHLWIVDERGVAFDDAESAFRLVRETIVDHSGIPPSQVHPLFPLGEEPDVAYEAALREALGWREKGQDRLDFAMLALGGEGTVAGLAPHSPLLSSRRLVGREPRRAAHDRNGADRELATTVDRFSLTPATLNATRFIGVFACGARCADPIRRMVQGRDSVDELPAKALSPLGGTLRWYVDAVSAGQ